MQKDSIEDSIIYIESTVNELFSSTKITQSYTNKEAQPIEFSVCLPISKGKKDLILESFIIKIGDKQIERKYSYDRNVNEITITDDVFGSSTYKFDYRGRLLNEKN